MLVDATLLLLGLWADCLIESVRRAVAMWLLGLLLSQRDAFFREMGLAAPR